MKRRKSGNPSIVSVAINDPEDPEELPEVTAALRELAQPGDLILTVGAGDIYTAGEALVKGE